MVLTISDSEEHTMNKILAAEENELAMGTISNLTSNIPTFSGLKIHIISSCPVLIQFRSLQGIGCLWHLVEKDVKLRSNDRHDLTVIHRKL